VSVRILGLENVEEAVDVVDLRHCVVLFLINLDHAPHFGMTSHDLRISCH